MNIPNRLLVEHLVEPFGTSVLKPRLSWWLPSGAARQDAFRIQAGTWDSGRVEAPDHLLVTYEGPAPASGERVEWRVKVWTDLGESDWSDWSHWEVGLLDGSDWTARWISPSEPERATAGERPAHLLRHEFVVEDAPARARVHATAHGLYELFLNGARVDDVELAPGSTSYGSHLDVQAYDVTDHLVPGANVLAAVVSDGWWRGKVGFTREVDCYGTELALLVQLDADLDDGSRVTVGTGPGWTTSTGEILRADLIDGQGEDLRLRPDGWDRPGFDDGDWSDAGVVEEDFTALSASPAPPTRRVEELRPVDVRRLPSGRHVVDLGQNINGWVRLEDLGPEGTEVTLVHGEVLDDSGEVSTDNLKPFDFLTHEPLTAGQVDRVVSRGRPGDVFEPRHTTHGFQYVGIEGHPGPLGRDDVTGVVVHTDLVRTGWFSCSDDRLDRLHEAAVWSFRDNACEVPTDCPQRERAGWTGDWQLFCPTAAYLYDVAGFSAKWLRDLRSDQWPDGRVPNILPEPHTPATQDNPVAQFMTGSAGWGDAAVIVPWEMWAEYGDERFLADGFDAMAAWVDFAAASARSGRHPSRAELRPDPAPHEDFLWDTGFHWGEWCEPGGNPASVFSLEQDMGDVATAFLYRSSSLLGRTATLLGRAAEADRFGELAASALAAWRAEFIDDDDRVRPDTQANLVRAIAFGLVPDDLRQAVADRLAELVHEAGDHLTTGFLATPYLLPVLADHGHLDVAYRLLFQDTVPSWLAMIDQGATTIWENWEGTEGEAIGSLNHYSKGAVVSFLHRYVAGLRPDEDHPGYERFAVAPMPGGGLTHAEAVHAARRGRVRSAWTIADGTFTLEVEVPPGAEATVVLPDGQTTIVGPGTSTHACPSA
ncbi:MAG: family 78 glycoside hydrolase catalytic domain [Acidimicrobiales bacterium]